MDRKYFNLFFLIMTAICLTDAKNMDTINIGKIAKVNMDCISLKPVHTTEASNIVLCAKLCGMMTWCRGISFKSRLCKMYRKKCGLFAESHGTLYSEIEGWPESVRAPCGSTQCSDSNMCVAGPHTSSTCLVTDKCYKDSHTWWGRRSYTVSNRVCQRWDSQTPHKHTRNNPAEFPDSSLANAANFCRDPKSSGSLWCYTTDPDLRWDYCGIPACDDGICYTNSGTWMGNQSRSYSNLICQRWDSQEPHQHSFTDASRFPDSSLAEAENYCRDPGGLSAPWCYTTDPNVRWEQCGIQVCEDDACFTNSSSWKGRRSHTISNRICQRWDDQQDDLYNSESFPDDSAFEAANFCRDPNKVGTLWCHVDGPLGSWEVCGIPPCTKGECFTNSSSWQGDHRNTKSNRTCQRWDSQSPHSHNFDASDFPDATLSDAADFCRDPNGRNLLWCYTTDPDVSWEYCSVPYCGLE